MTEHTKRMVTIFAIMVSLLPAILILQPPVNVTLRTSALYVSAIVGYWGIVLLLWMYALGTRAVTGLLFHDIAPVLAIHKWLGKYGIIAIFLHPVLITLSYGESWLYSLIPQASTLAERHILLGQIAVWLLAIVWVSSAFLRGRIAFRPWKYIHYLAYICIPFALLHVPDLGTQTMRSTVVKAYLFLLALTFIAFTIVRLRSILNLDKTRYQVVSQTRLTNHDFAVTLKPTGKRRLVPRSGEYVYVKLGILSEDHPFSVARYHVDTGELLLVYRTYGMYTKLLATLPAKTSVYLSGPYGEFTRELSSADTAPVVYIAGGIGITPFVTRIFDENNTREQWLFVANRSPESAVLVPELTRMLPSKCIRFYSRYDGVLQTDEFSTRLSATAIASYLHDLSRYTYYVCGPAGMVTAIENELSSAGVPASQIHHEAFGW